MYFKAHQPTAFVQKEEMLACDTYSMTTGSVLGINLGITSCIILKGRQDPQTKLDESTVTGSTSYVYTK